MLILCCCYSAEDRSRRVLMVRRLHPAVSMQSLLQTFGAFGSITGCKVRTDTFFGPQLSQLLATQQYSHRDSMGVITSSVG